MADFPSDTPQASAPRSAARSAARKRKRTRQEKGVGRRKKKEPAAARKRNVPIRPKRNLRGTCGLLARKLGQLLRRQGDAASGPVFL